MEARTDAKWTGVGVVGTFDRRLKKLGSHRSLEWSNLVEYLAEQYGEVGILGIVQAELRLRLIMEEAT